MSEQNLQRGEAAYKRRDYETAYREFLEAAEQGNAWAQIYLGWLYANGAGTQKDDAEAARWYRKAAEQGNAWAQSNLGWIYANGAGVPKAYAEAVRWYRKAAEQGNSWAQSILGQMYANGDGVPKDDMEAVRWYRKAAEQGDEKAQNNLGWMYANCEGIPKDDTKAVHWYRKAAEQGNAKAQTNLGLMYANGKGVPKDDTEAVYWYRKAAEQGNAWAQTHLGGMYAIGEGVSRDYIEAYKWLNLAAAQGEEGAARTRALLQWNMTPSQVAQAQARTREWRPSFGPILSSYALGDGAERFRFSLEEPAPWASGTPPDKTGSGFFVSAEHILTNAHVVANCSRLRISPDGSDAVVRALDRANDFALLQLSRNSTGRCARPARLRRGFARLGAKVVVSGYPLRGLVDSGLNVTRGEVSALSGLGSNSRHLQITAPVQPGNSGGPLLDRAGHVLGVVVSKLDAICAAKITGDIPQNVNFAIRATAIRAFLDAHNVPYKIAYITIARSTEKIAAKARAHTVLIECWK